MKHDWNKLYRNYYKHYKKEMVKSSVPLEPMYNKNEFKMMYQSLENDRLIEINKGTRKVLNINQDLIRGQKQYKYSMKQAKVLQKALISETNHKYTLKALRQGTVQLDETFWDKVHNYSGDLLIGQVFFGSD